MDGFIWYSQHPVLLQSHVSALIYLLFQQKLNGFKIYEEVKRSCPLVLSVSLFLFTRNPEL